MPSVRDLRDRIKSLKNTQQITKAMKQVAAARIRRAEAAMRAARPYAERMRFMLDELVEKGGKVDHPWLQPPVAGKSLAVVLLTADKGLAGAFNANTVREAERFVRSRGGESVLWYPVGTKAIQAVRRLRGEAPAQWLLAPKDLPMVEQARKVAQRLTSDFAEGRIGEIALVRPRFISMLTQRPEAARLIPIERKPGVSGGEGHAALASVEFEPDAATVLSALLPKYLAFTIFAAMQETLAGFFAAQLLAMTNATDNAGKLIEELTVAMNSARQAAITKEILEIAGGAEALRAAGH
ncbi:MAG: ATP synthase F1 subunit gamma [bacterium]|nr:ATP synthase F1 subunit gamma [bacterium]